MLMRAGLSSKLPCLFVSRRVLTLALDRAEKSLMHFWAAISVLVVVVNPEICRQSLRRGIRMILVKKALSETSLSEILDPNGN
jgi:hypothetical protein